MKTANFDRFPARFPLGFSPVHRSHWAWVTSCLPMTYASNEDPISRDRIATTVLDVALAERPAFVIANNKAEGSSPLTLERLAERIAAWAADRPQ